MIRYFFFILFFPPAFMNLLLVQAHPVSLAQYMLSGYVLASLSAAAIAVTDELLDSSRELVRTLCCGLVGLLSSVLVVSALGSVTMWRCALAACCGGVAAFLCSVAFSRFFRVRQVPVPAA